jgi:hypothetical protein
MAALALALAAGCGDDDGGGGGEGTPTGGGVETVEEDLLVFPFEDAARGRSGLPRGGRAGDIRGRAPSLDAALKRRRTAAG